MELLGIGRYLHLGEALYELEQMVKEELDFRFEASNMRRMRKSLRDHSILVPRVFRKLSGRRVLVSEYIDGVLMTDVIEVGRKEPDRLKRWTDANDVELKQIAKRLFYSCMRQLFEDNLFHADVHPGNILLLRENGIALIDFGTIGSTGKTFLARYRQSLSALAERNFEKAVDATMQLAIEPPSLDQIKPLRTELIRAYREWDALSQLTSIGYHERSMAAAGSVSGRVMARYGVQLSWDFMRISRTWATLDASISHLHPGANYMKLFAGYFARAERRARSIRYAVPRAVRAVTAISRSVQEYESLLGPDIRRRVIYSSAAVQMSQRFALSLIALLNLFKWVVYIVLIGGVAAIIDKHVADIVGADHAIINDFFQSVQRFGVIEVVLGLLLLVLLVYYVSQAVRRLNPKN